MTQKQKVILQWSIQYYGTWTAQRTKSYHTQLTGKIEFNQNVQFVNISGYVFKMT
jgi:hypothetical protein